MSKNFRPLFSVESTKSSREFRDETHKLLEEKKLLEERVKELEERLRSLEAENGALTQELSHLKEELAEKNSRLEKLLSELTSAKLEKKITEELINKVKESVDSMKENLKSDFVRLSKEVIKEFLLTDVIPKEELVTKILNEVFEGSLELRGSVKVYLNPADMDKVFEFIAGVKEKLGGKVDIEVLPDQGLAPGELRMETPKFVIERKHEEITEETIGEVVKRVLEGS
ncbi:flagellar biosynthesis/type III secretory pathway protein FliH [Hydrogenivirga caldilitoris]|uniref:Flagellar biosynthesis/type III secretory pathway protein FliH n=2 Tax=Hydrogenivirga caldilitoris TaxID=246264 RepID=A0A497XXM4_9AQUI|nr:flagellar biosynthesis/type III secretory pathway protein FliH [Hydrogenivirga caldilitoris]